MKVSFDSPILRLAKALSEDGVFGFFGALWEETVSAFSAMKSDLVSICEGIYNLLADLGYGVAYITKILGDVLVNVPGYFSWLPSSVTSVIAVTFGVVVIYMIANRK